MPLRSVEAATRDDAIAAAREQFGPSARVVGVRRVRSGGVLGFFATERYVAEVAPDLTNRPAVPAVTPAALVGRHPGRLLLTAGLRRSGACPGGGPGPQRRRRVGRRGRRATPETPAPRSRPSSSFASSARPARRRAVLAGHAGAPRGRPGHQRPDDDRVSELASLLAAKQAESGTPTYARSTFPRASVPRTGTPVGDEVAAAPAADKRVLPADVPDAPSPFTAALARMVAGDREVRQAVEEALVRPGAARPGADAEPRPVRPGANCRVIGAVACGAPGGGNGGRSGHRAALHQHGPDGGGAHLGGRARGRRRRRAPPARRRSPRCCARPSPRGTRTRRSPGSCARCSPGPPRRPR